MKSLYNRLCVSAYIKAHNIKEAIIKKANTPLLAGFFSLLFVSAAQAESVGVEKVLSNVDSLTKSIVATILNIAVVMGVGAILWGFKLVVDKSNDRENVKNSHIVFSFVGGAFLVILWFAVEALSSSAGSTGEIGGGGSW